MAQKVDLGVFLPVGNNGWIMSKNSPQYMPTWELNKNVSQFAESIGVDYVFSMAKWGGLDGETEYWNHTLESLTLMGGLAAVTNRMRLVASVSPLLTHPAIVAKMVVTVDNIAAGRLSLNIVSSNNQEYGRLGLYPDNWESFRYDYTYEWLDVCKRLWTEDRVDFKGKYFTLTDCMSGPKPVQKPHPRIVCATGSEAGFRFVAEQCDEAFLGSSMAVDKNTVGDKTAAKNNASQKAKEMARELGRTIKTQTLVIVVPSESDEQGKEIIEHYRQGADYEAITNLWDPGCAGDKLARGKELVGGPGGYPSRLFYYAPAFAGSPKTTADLLEELAVDGDFDGLLLSFPDYMEGLSYMYKKIMPILRRRHLLPEH